MGSIETGMGPEDYYQFDKDIGTQLDVTSRDIFPVDDEEQMDVAKLMLTGIKETLEGDN
jgi:hypothetical protein